MATVAELEKKAASETIEDVHERYGIEFGDLASALGVDRRTVLRYRNRRSVPRREVRSRLGKLREMSFLLSRVFDSPEDGLAWLFNPVPALRGRTPMEVIREGQVEAVVDLLAGIEGGVHY